MVQCVDPLELLGIACLRYHSDACLSRLANGLDTSFDHGRLGMLSCLFDFATSVKVAGRSCSTGKMESVDVAGVFRTDGDVKCR